MSFIAGDHIRRLSNNAPGKVLRNTFTGTYECEFKVKPFRGHYYQDELEFDKVRQARAQRKLKARFKITRMTVAQITRAVRRASMEYA